MDKERLTDQQKIELTEKTWNYFLAAFHGEDAVHIILNTAANIIALYSSDPKSALDNFYQDTLEHIEEMEKGSKNG
jgi:hypothetical protein